MHYLEQFMAIILQRNDIFDSVYHFSSVSNIDIF